MPAATSTSVNDRVQTVLDDTGISTGLDAHASDIDRLCGESTVADSTAVTNTTTETALDKVATVSADALAAGRTLRIDTGVAITGVTASPDLTVKLYLGDSSDVAGSLNIAEVAASSIGGAGGVAITTALTCRTAGASGTFSAVTSGAAVGASGLDAVASVVAGSVDTTGALELFAAVTWSAASASNSCKLVNLSYSLIGD